MGSTLAADLAKKQSRNLRFRSPRAPEPTSKVGQVQNRTALFIWMVMVGTLVCWYLGLVQAVGSSMTEQGDGKAQEAVVDLTSIEKTP